MPVSTLPSGSVGNPLTAPNPSRLPADLVLVLDRSGSMTPERLSYMKQGAKRVAERFCAAEGCRVGLVTYSGTARTEVPLTNQRSLLQTAIDTIRPGGTTDHAAALSCAHSLFDPASFRRQAVLLVTDGDTTGRENPSHAAHLLKADGIRVLAVGLGSCLPPLECWVSAPVEECLTVTSCPSDLPERMETLIAPLLCHVCDQPRPAVLPLRASGCVPDLDASELKY